MAKGIIYLMSTVVDGLVKIGKTDKFENRMRELERNGYYNITGLKRQFAIEVNDYDKKETLIHNIFSKSRIANSELFSIDLDLAKQLLASFDGKIIYPKQTRSEIFTNATDAVEEKEIFYLNKHNFKEFEFYSSLTNKNYYTKINQDGYLTIFELDTDVEIINHSKPSKKQIVLQALKDLKVNTSETETLYQLVRKLQKINYKK